MLLLFYLKKLYIPRVILFSMLNLKKGSTDDAMDWKKNFVKFKTYGQIFKLMQNI